MRLNNKFLNESLVGSEALKLEDWGAFNTEFQSCLGFQGVGAAEGSRVSFAVLVLEYVANDCLQQVVSFPFPPCHH